jgi:hypothetical protein
MLPYRFWQSGQSGRIARACGFFPRGFDGDRIMRSFGA